MPNGNIKTNKTKIVARVMLVILLISSTINFCSCDMKYRYIKNSFESSHDHISYLPSYFVATSNTRFFDINDVTFNIAYATHQIQAKNPKAEYSNALGETPPLYFGLYISPYQITYEDFWGFENQEYNDISSLRNIEGYTFVNEITDEEVFTKEYALTPTPSFISNGSIYNHTESITIPNEYITGDHGGFMLKLICFFYREAAVDVLGEPINEGYYCMYVQHINFYYEKIYQNTIKIDFEYKFMNNER